MSDHPTKQQRSDLTTSTGGWQPSSPSSATLPAASDRPGDSPFELDLKERQLRVDYQPIVDLESNSVFAHEALARSSSGRLAGPREMFEAASRVGKVGELGRVLRQMAVQHSPPLPLFVNVHPSELEAGWLAREDEAIFWHRSAVYVEISESVPMRHRHLCQTIVRELRGRGVFLAIDDLGADMSNLQAIAELAPDVIKLDRAMIAGLHLDTRQLRFVKHLVRLCTDMGSRVVAEGIETNEELQAVVEAGVQFAQGHLFSRPTFPAPDASKLVLPHAR
jgi:EAL domain-containing protein (putative c-di-GMP-specific phosphodiesterase class I)